MKSKHVRRRRTQKTKTKRAKRTRRKQGKPQTNYGSYFLRGGKRIGAGTFGCVYNPPLRCKGEVTRAENSISKFMTARHAMREVKEFEVMKQIDPTYQFHLGISKVCVPEEPEPGYDENYREDCKIWDSKSDKTLNDYRILVEPNGGFIFESLSKRLPFLKKMPTTPKHATQWNSFLTGMERIMYGLMEFGMNGFLHNDIKGDNIVVNPNTFEMNYIDFGMVESFDHTIEAIQGKGDKNYRYAGVDFFFSQPPEAFILSRYKRRYGTIARLVHHGYHDRAEKILKKLNEEYQTIYKTGDSRYIEYTRIHDKHFVSSDFRRSTFAFTEDIYEFVDLYSPEKLPEIILKWDTYALGMMFMLVWFTLFRIPFSVGEYPASFGTRPKTTFQDMMGDYPITSEPHQKDMLQEMVTQHPKAFEAHPFVMLQDMIGDMVALDYRERARPDELYHTFRDIYQEIAETVLKPLNPAVKVKRPIEERVAMHVEKYGKKGAISRASSTSSSSGSSSGSSGSSGSSSSGSSSGSSSSSSGSSASSVKPSVRKSRKKSKSVKSKSSKAKTRKRERASETHVIPSNLWNPPKRQTRVMGRSGAYGEGMEEEEEEEEPGFAEFGGIPPPSVASHFRPSRRTRRSKGSKASKASKAFKASKVSGFRKEGPLTRLQRRRALEQQQLAELAEGL